MASRGGPRAAGTDGTDYTHRQKVSSTIKLSVQYKFYLKLLFGAHFLVLIAMWTKVGGEVLVRELGFKNKFWSSMDLPSAYPWEYMWCFSFIPIVLALVSFPRNRADLLKYHYYSQFIFGILPCSIGLGSQFPELVDYLRNMEESKTPTFKGQFPMVILWYIFFLLAFQLHGFAMFLAYYLQASWQRDVKKSD